MFQRLNPISVVRFLVFAETCLLVWHPSGRFNSWNEINASLEASVKQIQYFNTAIIKSLQDQDDTPASHDRMHPFFQKTMVIVKDGDLILKKIDILKQSVEKHISTVTKVKTSIREIDSLVGNLKTSITENVNAMDSEILSKYLPIMHAHIYTDLSTKDKLFEKLSTYNGRKRAIAVLSAFQADICNSISIFLYQIQQESSIMCCMCDGLDAISFPIKCHAIPGEKVTAKIMMIAYNPAVRPQITTNEGIVERTENGIGDLYIRAPKNGWHTVSGTVTVSLKISGPGITKPYSFKYFVGEPYIQLYVKDQNFIYANVPSPVTVEGHGYALEDMSLVVPGAEVTSISPGHFEVLVNGPHKAAITAKLIAKDKTGKMLAVDAMILNVIEPALPVAGFGTNTGGPITVDYLLQHDSLNARFRDDDIGGMHPVITQYEVSYFSKENLEEVGPYMIRGKSLDYQPAIKQILMSAKKGDRITINEIKCRYLDGRLFSLDPCSYIIE